MGRNVAFTFAVMICDDSANVQCQEICLFVVIEEKTKKEKKSEQLTAQLSLRASYLR